MLLPILSQKFATTQNNYAELGDPWILATTPSIAPPPTVGENFNTNRKPFAQKNQHSFFSNSPGICLNSLSPYRDPVILVVPPNHENQRRDIHRTVEITATA